MRNSTHKVVILNKVNSEIISQAIFILKNPDGLCESAVLAEAERVVEKYMQDTSAPTEKGGQFMVAFISIAIVILTGICVFAVKKLK